MTIIATRVLKLRALTLSSIEESRIPIKKSMNIIGITLKAKLKHLLFQYLKDANLSKSLQQNYYHTILKMKRSNSILAFFMSLSVYRLYKTRTSARIESIAKNRVMLFNFPFLLVCISQDILLYS